MHLAAQERVWSLVRRSLHLNLAEGGPNMRPNRWTLMALLALATASAAAMAGDEPLGRIWPDFLPWVQEAPQFYVAPEGAKANTGAKDSPWDYLSVLGGAQKVPPGSIIWFRGGVYGGGAWNQITCRLKGTPERPIIVRQYPGEIATLDGGIIFPRDAGGEWVWFWGLEVMSSSLDRTRRTPGFYVNTRGVSMINCIVHDVGHGPFSWWVEVGDGAEVHGCLLWGSGYYDLSETWQGNPRGSGFYTQNQEGTRYITDNISFRQFTNAIKCWGFNGYVQGFHIEGNVTFDTNGWNIFAAAAKFPIERLKLISNYTYRKPFDTGDSVQLGGYGAVITDAVVRDNYLVAGEVGDYALRVTKFQWLDMADNTFIGRLEGAQESDYPHNACVARRPDKGVRVFVRPNKYEPGRGHVIVYNWEKRPSVEVDLSGILPPGTPFELRDAQDYFGTPIVRGTYTGAPVRVPMNLTKVAQPVGDVPHIRFRFAHTAPEFAVFVVVSRGGLGPLSVVEPPPAPAPRLAMSPRGGVFTKPVTVTLSVEPGGASAGAAIRYTTDGADPTPQSSRYEKPFPLEARATVKARLFAGDAPAGDVVAADFRIVAEDQPPVISDGAPDGKIDGAPKDVTVAVKTDEPATVKYALEPGVPYEKMPFTFATTRSTEHAHALKDVKPGSVHRLYLKAQDALGNANLDDYCVDFYAPDGFAPFRQEIEAEAGKLSGTMTVVANDAASGGKYVTAALGMMGAIRAAYTFTVPCTGEYVVWARVWGPDSGSDSFFVSVDDGPEDVFDIDEKNRTKQWRWTALNGRGFRGKRRPLTLDPRVLLLTKGEHTLVFRGRESDACLDRLIITNDPAFTPEPK